ncbi:glutamyl-tRNA reductase [bacterium]|nr:glutamyl-tRNA reductase [bacterium]
MRILCVGLNWKTPIGVRERISFDRDSECTGLKRLREQYKGGEFAILSTCNRTEIFAASPDGVTIARDDLARFVSESRDISLDEFFPYLYAHEGRPAASHLFEVAAGLDSLVLGEVQILGQVKEAYQIAVESGAAGPVLHALFQKSFNVAKRIQTETGLSKGRFSIASAAVDYIKGVFEVFRDKTILIIGAGKMAELTMKHLAELEPARVIVTNRNPDRAKQLAEKLGGQTWDFKRLHDALVDADIVISSTAAEDPIIHASEFAQVMKARKQRLIAIVDIAVPRDFDSAIAELPNVLLWNIDDLEKVRNQTVRARKSEMRSALSIVEEELEKFEASLAAIKTGPIITQLDREYQRIIDDELAWLFPQLNGLPDVEKDKIRHFAHRIKNKLLHTPKTALRDHSKEGHHTLLENVQRLFGLTREDDE